jgi:hypothetical protein
MDPRLRSCLAILGVLAGTPACGSASDGAGAEPDAGGGAVIQDSDSFLLHVATVNGKDYSYTCRVGDGELSVSRVEDTLNVECKPPDGSLHLAQVKVSALGDGASNPLASGDFFFSFTAPEADGARVVSSTNTNATSLSASGQTYTRRGGLVASVVLNGFFETQSDTLGQGYYAGGFDVLVPPP